MRMQPQGKGGGGSTHFACRVIISIAFFSEFLSDTTKLFFELRWQSYDNSSNTFVFSYVETQDFDKLDLPLLFFFSLFLQHKHHQTMVFLCSSAIFTNCSLHPLIHLIQCGSPCSLWSYSTYMGLNMKTPLSMNPQKISCKVLKKLRVVLFIWYLQDILSTWFVEASKNIFHWWTKSISGFCFYAINY